LELIASEVCRWRVFVCLNGYAYILYVYIKKTKEKKLIHIF
jgi:hypothetical protein